MFEMLANTVKIAHYFLEEKIAPGCIVVDATIGNGQDTVFLSKLVGSDGQVYGFDIQASAIEKTTLRLKEEGYFERVKLFQTGHENLKDIIKEPVDGIIFNLGYLPGGDHNLITKPETTIKALSEGVDLLKPGGLITIVVYPGHEGGTEEARVVDEFTSKLRKSQFSVTKTTFINRSNTTPYLILIEKSLKGDSLV